MRSRACSRSCSTSRASTAAASSQSRNFELAEIFRKIRLHFEPGAFEKGLSLRIRGGRHVAFADPLLVERIVRNLVSNAIRYTSDGSVLVSCRRRDGHLLMQVWDTGPGIANTSGARLRGVLPGAGRAAVGPSRRRASGSGWRS